MVREDMVVMDEATKGDGDDHDSHLSIHLTIFRIALALFVNILNIGFTYRVCHCFPWGEQDVNYEL